MKPTPSSSIPQEYSSKVKVEWPGVSKSRLSVARGGEKNELKPLSAITIIIKPAHVPYNINRARSVINIDNVSYAGHHFVKKSSADYTHSRRN